MAKKYFPNLTSLNNTYRQKSTPPSSKSTTVKGFKGSGTTFKSKPKSKVEKAPTKLEVKKYHNYIKYISDSFNFKHIFLELTKHTIPYGHEEELEPILYGIVPGLQKDGKGNYHIKIGNSKTLFTSHLDTYSKNREKITHVINGDVISTDGTTVLGGDNKNGVLVLLYMIKKGIPGNYYFFVGEEGIVKGTSCNGSTWLLKNDPSIYTSMDRAIAFDRRGKGSVVTKQRARHCCSDEFADAIVDEFAEQGLEFKKDYAYGTDSAVFMDIVPEITNISSGGEYEHSFMESTDIAYTEKIAKAACKIDWEGLPTVRKAEPVSTSYPDREYNQLTYTVNHTIYKNVSALLAVKGFNCINAKNFYPNAVMHFRQYTEDKYIDLRFISRKAFVVDTDFFDDDVKEFTAEELKKILVIDIETSAKRVIGRIVNTMDKDYEITRWKLNAILNRFLLSFNDFKEYIDNSEEYKDLFVFSPTKIKMDVIANQATTVKRQKEQEEKDKK